jgi:hypothetical protein
MKIYNASLKGMMTTKPNVIHGSLRNGLEEQYVCHGYRKNPLDCDIGEYTFNAGVSETVQYSIKRGISQLVGEMEEKVMAEIKTANFEACAGYDDFSGCRMYSSGHWCLIGALPRSLNCQNDIGHGCTQMQIIS